MVKVEAAIASATDEPFSLKDFAESLDKDAMETPFFSRMDYIPRIPGTEDSPEFTRCALSLEPGQCSGVLEVKQKLDQADPEDEPEWQTTGYYVIQSLEKKEPDFTKFDDQKESIKNQILYSRGRLSVKGWLEELRSRAKIENKNKDLVASFKIDQESKEETVQEVEPSEIESSTQESESSSG